MATRNIQVITNWTWTNPGDKYDGMTVSKKNSFTTLELAKQNARGLINRHDMDVHEITIINKETKEVLWAYNK